jgi:hypothetical protein
MFRWRRLHRADRIGCRKTAYQAGFKLRMHLAIRRGRLAWIGGMPVMRRGIEFLSHDILRFRMNGLEANGGVSGKFLLIPENLVPTEEPLQLYKPCLSVPS